MKGFRVSDKTCFVARSSEDYACADAGSKSPEAAPGGSLRTFRAKDNAGASCSQPQQKEVLLEALKTRFLNIAAAAVLAAFILTPLKAEEIKGDVIIFHAGSLAVPFKQMAEAFQKEHSGTKLLLEAAGSRDCARKISELGRPCDVMASADYLVIDTLLIPEHADWNIKFARNELSLVYGEKSRMSDGINAENWYKVIMQEEVAFGRANPDADPCGYRTVLALKLSEQFYSTPGLAEEALAKDTRYIRPKEVDLLALLETGEIDYIFLYRSVAEQHGLHYVRLPDEVNLGNPEMADLYDTVSVELSGKDPGTTLTQKGAPMVYGVTIPKNPPNPAAAEAFVKFLLDTDKGLAIMEKNGQASVVPATTKTFGRIPEALKGRALPPKE